MSENWVDGTLESGADGGSVPDTAGAELGLADGEPNSFEPEEADPAVGDDADPGESPDS